MVNSFKFSRVTTELRLLRPARCLAERVVLVLRVKTRNGREQAADLKIPNLSLFVLLTLPIH